MRRQRNDLALFDAGLQRRGDVLVNAVHHARCDVEQRDFVVVLDFAGVEHHLLAVAHLNAFFLQREKHRRFANVEAERHVRHAFLLEDFFDLFGGLL